MHKGENVWSEVTQGPWSPRSPGRSDGEYSGRDPPLRQAGRKSEDELRQ